MTKRPVQKKAQVYEAQTILNGKLGSIDPPRNWGTFLAQLNELSLEKRTIDGIIYEPVMRDGVDMLAMHKPISTAFLSELDADQGSFFDYIPDNAGRLYANSTVVGFLNPGIMTAICKGKRESPGAPELKRFFDKFLQVREGTPTSWTLVPIETKDRREEFKNSDGGVTWYKSRFNTHPSLFDDLTRGLHSRFGGVSVSTRTSLDISFEIKIPKDQRTRETQRALKEFILRDIDDVAGPNSGARVRAISADGEAEIMNLVAENLTIEFDMPPESTERQSFSDLAAGLHTVLSSLQDHLDIVLDR